MPKVSVIVPVYNVASYIERCARSLLDQTLDDIEYLFIDDCSPDNSIEILERLLSLYPKDKQQAVRIVKSPTNGGQAAVRRRGIQLATGTYVIHCDSDDWVDVELYERMYNEAVRSGADIVMCPIRDEYKEGWRNRSFEKLPSTCNEVLENWYRHSVGMFAWNKLVRRDIYVNHDILPFEGINMWEDNGLLLRLFYYGKGLSSIDGAYYHYNHTNQNALTNGYGEKAVSQMLECAYLVHSFLEEKPDYKRYENTALALKFFARINLVTDSFTNLRKYYRTYTESDAIIHYISTNAFSSKGKIRFWFVRHHLAWLFVLLFKAKNMILRNQR